MSRISQNLNTYVTNAIYLQVEKKVKLIEPKSKKVLVLAPKYQKNLDFIAPNLTSTLDCIQTQEIFDLKRAKFSSALLFLPHTLMLG